MLSCNSESDKERWFEALSAPKSDDPNETLYECWDCPQVTAIHSYTASQPDELPLSRGDIVNVTRKVADGKSDVKNIFSLDFHIFCLKGGTTEKGFETAKPDGFLLTTQWK